MPWYAFYLQDGQDNRLEVLGRLQAPDDQFAYSETVDALREILAGSLLSSQQVNGTALIIVGEHGQQVGKVRFTDLLPNSNMMTLGHA